PKDNWNYSRSALFSFGIPLWHTGFHVGYALVPDRFFANAYIYQGWNTINDNNAAATWGAQLKWTPSEKTSVIYNYIGGPEQPQNTTNWKQVHDFIATQTFSDLVSVAVEGLYGRENHPTTSLNQATWVAGEVLGKFQFTKKYALSPRFEVYRD